MLESPKYIHFSDKKRNEFLSQIGNFSLEERQVFLKLCSSWNYKLSYQKTSNMLVQQSAKHTAALQSLMKKLEAPGVGLVRSKIADKHVVPDYIVLADENSARFWYEYLSEWMMQCLLSPSKPLPLRSEIMLAQKTYPQEVVKSVSFDTLLNEAKTTDPSLRIFELSLDDTEKVLVAHEDISQLTTALILKLRYLLHPSGIMSKLGQVMGIALRDVQKMLAGRDLVAWQKISRTIQSHHTKIVPDTRQDASKEIYYYSICLFRYSEAMEKIHESEQKEQKKIDSDYVEILSQIKSFGKAPIDKGQFDNIIGTYEKKYEGEFPNFHRTFMETYTASITSTKLPPVIMFEKGFIHEDNIFLYFYDNYLRLCQELGQYYESALVESIQGTHMDEMFLSGTDFENSVKQEAKIRNPFVTVIIEKSLFFAEIIMHHVQTTSKRNKVKDAERLLGRFFFAESMSLKPYSEIFELDTKKIFTRAFKKLGFFRKILMKLTGRYASLLDKFSRQLKSEDVMPEETEWETPAENLQKNYLLQKLNSSQASETQKKPEPRKTVEPEKKAEKNDAPPPQEPSSQKSKYSAEELNKFWDSFKSSMDQ